MTPLEKALISLMLEVDAMRQAQRQYFAKHAGLQTAQRLEAKVDARIAKAKESGVLDNKPPPQQSELFP